MLRDRWFRIATWVSAAAFVAYAVGAVVLVFETGAERRNLGYSAMSLMQPRLVTYATPGQPFEVGDEFVAINGRSLGAQYPRFVIDHLRPGESYRATVLRRGELTEFTVQVTGRATEVPWRDVVLAVVRAVVFFLCGLLVAVKKPDDATARWAALALWLFAINSLIFMLALAQMNNWSVPVFLQLLRGVSLLLEWVGMRFLMQFPTPVARWVWWSRLSWIALAFGLAAASNPWTNAIVRVLPAEWATWVWVFYVGPFTPGPMQVLQIATLVVLLGLVAVRLREPRESQDRLRLAWLLVPIAVSALLAMMASLSASRGGAIEPWLQGNLVVAPAIAYALLAQQVLGFRVVVRRTVQYVLARPLVEAVLLGPIVLALVRAVQAPERAVNELGDPAWLVPVAMVGVVMFPFVRVPLARWIDRRFFRSAWVEDQVVDRLLRQARTCTTPEALADVMRQGVVEAWHPEVVRVYLRTHRTGALRDANSGHRLPEGDVMRRLSDGAVIVAPVVDETGAHIPWALAVPVVAPGGDLLGAMFISEKKSHLPYSERDRQVLLTLGRQLGLLLDHAWLEQERVDVVVAERTRIARDLHDTLAQGFAAIGLHLDLGIQQASHEQAQWHMEEARRLARESLASARRSVHDLRASADRNVDVPLLLRRMIDHLSPAFEVRSTIDGAGMEQLSDHARQHVLRVAQEALTNIVKHSQATRIDVALRVSAGEMVLEVRDDGRGFDSTRPGRPEGYGIVGMRERSRLLGASLEVASEQNEGTRVTLRVPVA
jgi:signal transduction histidine kinase